MSKSQISKTVAIVEIRRIARENGLTFKEQFHHVWVDGKRERTYKFIVATRSKRNVTEVVVIKDILFWTAYADCMSGYIETWDGSKFNHEEAK